MTPRTSIQLEKIREAKRSLIMQSALEHFAKNGYYATTISHIAKHAGISKGLMYNYFPSKEALLKEIIYNYIQEIYQYFDINRDGYLTEEEFEYFIHQIYRTLKEKKSFFQLLFQMMMQSEVRLKLIELQKSIETLAARSDDSITALEKQIYKTLSDYFKRKKEKAGQEYDSDLELNIFIYTIKGFALTYVFNETEFDEEYFEKSVNKIIELYK
ncbi:MAG TPA: TetR/AcrR family transcriptional regulator [Bacteroidales bacterium]|nr:TetR/AcrR family transcriptional regulator [Bacteroidales bacterium]HOK75804.1 TetR/AcrR family transcriptional regulator [Bacteroidales bacterium]HPP93010.1 TetR/AcrR family transcriptional regulator [Bacteroidales bacterium]